MSVRTCVFQDLDMNELVFPPVFRLLGLLPQGCGWHSRESVGLSVQGSCGWAEGGEAL